MSNFACPYCHWVADADNLAEEHQHSFGLVVCPGCAGYVLRQDGEWSPVNYDEVGELNRRAPGVLAQLEAQRIKILKPWVNEETLPPTLFAATMAQMVRARGWDVIRWKGAHHSEEGEA